MNALVTGATGFVGMHLAKKLKTRGDKVHPAVGIDDGMKMLAAWIKEIGGMEKFIQGT